MNLSISTLLLCIVAGTIAGCTSAEEPSILGPPVAEWSYAPLSRHESTRPGSSVASGVPLLRSGQGGQTQTIPGTGRFIDPAPSRSGEHTQEVQEDDVTPNRATFRRADGVTLNRTNFPQEDGVTLNLVNLPISEAAKVVMGDILSLNYVVDPKLDGKVTVHTAQPVKKSTAIALFQSALRVSGAAVVENGGLYKIVPLDQAPTSGEAISDGPVGGPSNQIGQNARVVQLRYVSAADMKRVLEPIVPQAAILRADHARNALTLSGTAQDIATLQDAIAMFDVDTMRGMSFALVPVKSSDADALAEDLRNVFGSEREGPMNGMIRFIGNKRLSAILVISSQGQYLSSAEAWIHRLDARAQDNEKQFYSYHVQNRPAKELVAVLSAMFSADAANGKGNNVGPRYSKATISSNPPDSGGMPTTSPLGGALNTGGADSGSRGANGFIASNSAGGGPAGASLSQASANSSVGSSSSSTGSGPQAVALGEDSRFKLAVDEAKNTLVVMATAEDYKRFLHVIERLDVSPNQVYIEATIAEVTLNDDLRFGVQWWLQKHASQLAFAKSGANSNNFTNPVNPSINNIVGGALGGVFPGFSYVFQAGSAQVTLHALNQITNVNIISTPSLTVLDNRQAVLQVGDQVPILTQQATSNIGGFAPTINSVAYRDTGMILAITPHIGESGRVMLEIQQEASNVAADTTTANLNSPTIQQRRIKTDVVVKDGAALMLGGLTQNSRTHSDSQLPVLGDIPIIGNAFKDKGDLVAKTELIIMITPHVVRSVSDAQEITDEFKHKLLNISTRAITGPHTIKQSVRRIISNE